MAKLRYYLGPGGEFSSLFVADADGYFEVDTGDPAIAELDELADSPTHPLAHADEIKPKPSDEPKPKPKTEEEPV